MQENQCALAKENKSLKKCSISSTHFDEGTNKQYQKVQNEVTRNERKLHNFGVHHSYKTTKLQTFHVEITIKIITK